MKKILILLNDDQRPEKALQYTAQLARQLKATVFGLIIQNLHATGQLSLFQKITSVVSEPNQELQKTAAATSNIEWFHAFMTTENIPFKVHIIGQNILDSLVDHSAFADLMICDADTPPSQYSIKTLLANAHCPVLMINKDFERTDNLVLTYDDNSSSIHAVKMFTYLFTMHRDLPVYFVSVLPHNVLGIQYEDLVHEWLPLHYPNAKIKLLHGEAKEELAEFINNIPNPLVVMGAFGRSSFSRFFKESLANLILEQTNAPIFIAHD